MESVSLFSEVKIMSGGDIYPPLPYKPGPRKLNEMYIQTMKSLGCMEPGKYNGISNILVHFICS